MTQVEVDQRQNRGRFRRIFNCLINVKLNFLFSGASYRLPVSFASGVCLETLFDLRTSEEERVSRRRLPLMSRDALVVSSLTRTNLVLLFSPSPGIIQERANQMRGHTVPLEL